MCNILSIQEMCDITAAQEMYGNALDKLEALNQLGLPEVYIWEADDSPDAYEFIIRMHEHSYDFGGRVILLETYNVKQVDKDHSNGTIMNVHSGKYIYVAH